MIIHAECEFVLGREGGCSFFLSFGINGGCQSIGKYSATIPFKWRNTSETRDIASQMVFDE